MGPPMHHPHYPQYPQYPNYVPVPPAPFPSQQVFYVRNPSDFSRRARKAEKLGGKRTKKRKSNDLLNNISQLIKKARPDPTPARRNAQSGPSGFNPGPPRTSTPSSSIPRSSGSKIDSEDNQSSEEGKVSSEDYDSSESESDGTEYSDNEAQNLTATTAAGLRKELHRYIQEEMNKRGGMGSIPW